jgi:Uma2 family endonuclease
MTAAAPTRPALTPDDLLAMGDAGRGYELVGGELREVEVSTESSHVAGEVYLRLKLYSAAHRPGWVFPEGTGYCCFRDDPTRVRKPDTSYVALDRLTPQQYRASGYLPVAPDLVVEVVSPNDIAQELDEKRHEWLEAGVREVWIVYPATRVVHADRADGGSAFYRATDTLTAPGLLPGFAVPVADLFRLPGGPPAPAAAPTPA